eukprot:1203890-Rhodomonas_salina.1
MASARPSGDTNSSLSMVPLPSVSNTPAPTRTLLRQLWREQARGNGGRGGGEREKEEGEEMESKDGCLG